MNKKIKLLIAGIMLNLSTLTIYAEDASPTVSVSNDGPTPCQSENIIFNLMMLLNGFTASEGPTAPVSGCIILV